MDHKNVLNKIDLIDNFFKSIGLKKVRELDTTWDLDSYIKYQPIEDNYTINYKGEKRVLINVEVGIVSGILFILSGKMGVSVYESVKTDYDFKGKFDDVSLLKDEFRNWSIDNILN